jgi:hypothetical protein
MDDQYIKPAEFARLVGISRQGVSDAISKGLIPAVQVDGKNRIDLNDQHIIDYMRNRDKKPVEVMESKQTDNSKPVEVVGIKKHKTNKPDKVVAAEIPEYLKHIADSGDLSFDEMMTLSKSEVDKIKSYEMIKSIKQKREENRLDLIERRIVRQVIGKLYTIDRDELINIKSKIVADISGVMECNDEAKMLKSEKIIEDELWKILKHIQHEVNKFLKQIKEKPLE